MAAEAPSSVAAAEAPKKNTVVVKVFFLDFGIASVFVFLCSLPTILPSVFDSLDLMTKLRMLIAQVGLIGDSQIGKTSLMVKYVEGRLDEDYIETLGVNFMVRIVAWCSSNRSERRRVSFAHL